MARKLKQLKGRRRGKAERSEKQIQRHLEALGLDSVAAYKSWCHTHGLSSVLTKNDSQRSKEIELANRLRGEATLARVKRQTRRPREIIVQISENSVTPDELGAGYLRSIHTAFESLKDKKQTRQVFLDLLMHVERCADLLEAGMAIPAFGQSEHNTFIAGLKALAGHHADWRRPLKSWTPRSHNPHRQFSALTRHLLAQYDVPLFMDSAWFLGDGENGHLQQNWFKHVGCGQNIRTADVPVSLTRRMAHLFLQSPDDSTIDQALRRAQVIGKGGGEALYRAVQGCQLGESFEHESFWETVIQFLVNNPMLDPDYVGPIVDFIHNQKFVPEQRILAGGLIEEGPPPQPGFSMKGRSLDKLLHQTEEWHGQLAQNDRAPLAVWPSSGIGAFSLVEPGRIPSERQHWTIRELRSARELSSEGAVMHHCVASYGRRCMRGDISIWSLQMEDAKRQRHPVLTIAVNNHDRTVSQARGKYNISASGSIRNPRQKGIGSGYLNLLKQARSIMKLWMKQESLTARM